MSNPAPSQLTVHEIIEQLPKDATLTERELVLLDHLTAAVDEIDALTRELKEAQAKAAAQEVPHADA